jgi:hypothetical protein
MNSKNDEFDMNRTTFGQVEPAPDNPEEPNGDGEARNEDPA